MLWLVLADSRVRGKFFLFLKTLCYSAASPLSNAAASTPDLDLRDTRTLNNVSYSENSQGSSFLLCIMQHLGGSSIHEVYRQEKHKKKSGPKAYVVPKEEKSGAGILQTHV